MGTTSFLRSLARAEDATARERWDDAARLWLSVVEANPVDGLYWWRLADARHSTEDFRGAIEAFGHAFDLREHYPSHTACRIARCHARLGDDEAAMDWLERAFALGYHDLEAARKED